MRTPLPCPGCQDGKPRISSADAIKAGERVHGSSQMPRTWSICLDKGGFHVPENEIDRVKEVLRS